jgi:hypothetical protein
MLDTMQQDHPWLFAARGITAHMQQLYALKEQFSFIKIKDEVLG